MRKPKIIKKLSSFARQTLKTKKNRRKLIYITSALLILGLVSGWHYSHVKAEQAKQELLQRLETKDHQLNDWEIKLQTLNKALQDVQKQKTDTEAQLQEKAAKQAELQSQIDNLNQQLQTKRQAQLSVATKPVQVQTATYHPTASGVVSGCGDNFYASFIYNHESGCRLDARNANSCLGIGQACPGSKLLAVCPDLNYGCQNSFFTSYAGQYGGWQGAYNFWTANHWW